MKSQQGIQTTKQQAPSSPIFVQAERLFEQMKEFSQSVTCRAYEYFEARGRELGHDLEDWFRALGRPKHPGDDRAPVFERPADIADIEKQQRFVRGDD